MSLIYITGISGAGKSAVCAELARRGYEAHEGDDRLCAFYDNETNKEVARPKSLAVRTPEWRAKHTWKMSVDKLLVLKKEAAAKPIFICGVAANEEEYIELFDKVFTLTLDLQTMKDRIENRTNNDFGKSKHEMDMLIAWQQSTPDYYKKIDAVAIDARKPLSEVVAEIESKL